MKESKVMNELHPFLRGGGELGELTRNYSWSDSSIGSPDQWPITLQITVSNLLRSRFPMFLWWGDEMIQFYNDAYRPSLGIDGKHPHALGQKGKECWPEIWHIIFPLIRQVQTTGEPTWMEDQLVPIYRNGRLEDVYWTYSYSSVLNAEGVHAGILVICVETTEKVLNEKKVQQSEQTLRNLILQAPVAMCRLKGPQHVVEIANDGMYELWGRSKEELLNKSIFEGLPEVKDQGYEELLNEVFTTGKRFSAFGIPVTLPRDGNVEIIYINLLYEAFREGDGTISGVMAVASDVTEQVIARRKIEESEAELQRRVEERTADLQQQQLLIGSILDASFNGIYSLKAIRNKSGIITDFSYLFANKIVANMLQLSVDEMVGRSMLELIPENKANGFFDIFCNVLNTGVPVHDETHFVTGKLNHWFDFIVIRIDDDTLVVTVQNITEKKKVSEEIQKQKVFLDTVVSNATSGLLYCQAIRDLEGTIRDFRVVLANEMAAKLSGFSDVKEFSSLTLNQIHERARTEEVTAVYINIVETGNPQSFEYFLSSMERWYTISVVKLGDGFLTTCTDISQTKALQLQLEDAIVELKHSNQNLQEFAYAASHDLKEPARKVRLFSDRLRTRLSLKLEEQDEHYFARLETAAIRMETLIDDLLLYSEISRGSIVQEMVDLNHTIAVVQEDLELQIEEKRAKIIADPLPVIYGHKRQFQQLFQNLFANSLKYSKPGVAPEITIRYSLVPHNKIILHGMRQAQQYHVIEFNDNGIGFAQEESERIFNVFTRLHGNGHLKGTGVGLSIVKKVANNHHGDVTAESMPGVGARFTIYLPVE